MSWFKNMFQSVASQAGSLVNRITGGNLTGAEREANEFSAQQAQVGRDWQEEMYNKYNSPQSLVDQYEQAGLNPALMFGGSTPSMDTASSSPSSVSPSSAGGILGLLQSIVGLQTAKADIGLKEAQAESLRIGAEGTKISNQFLRETYDLRKEALEIGNNLSRAQKDLVYQRKEESIASMKNLLQQADTEASRRNLFEAQSILYRMEAYEIVEMMPYKQQYMNAQTSAQKAYAALMGVQQLYQQKLIDSGYVESLAREMSARADSAEAQAAVNDLMSAIRTGNTFPQVNFGDSKIANFFEGLVNGAFVESANNGLAVMFNLLQGMPNVLVGANSGTPHVSSSVPLIYGADGNPLSKITRK